MSDLKNRGWVRLHRKIEDNGLWFSEPFTKAQAWIDLFLNANHKEGIVNIRGNIIKIERGQIAWSELTMTKRWTWSKNKVRRFLKYLETEQQIEQQKDRFITTVITILNYDNYQSDTPDDTAERQQKDSRRYINKNVKNDNNVKNGKKEERESVYSKEFLEFWNVYPSKVGKGGAYQAWKKAKLPSLAEILKAVESQSSQEKWKKDNGRFIPNPATWLNQCRWEDEITSIKKNTKYDTNTETLSAR